MTDATDLGTGGDCPCCGEPFVILAEPPPLHVVGEPVSIRVYPECPNGCFR